MRLIITILFLTLLVSACTRAGQNAPKPTSAVPQPEVTGSQTNSEQQGNTFSISTDAYYQASTKSATSPGRVISLSLTPAGRAEMVTDYLDKSPAIIDTGKWTTLNNNLLLNLKGKNSKDSILLEFKTDGDKLVYTGTAYGAEGLILWVKPIPE